MNMVHRPIIKHVRKHHKKYNKFFLFFLVLVIFGIVEDVLAIYITKSETFFEVIGVAIILSFAFTLIGEGFEKIYAYEKKHLKF